MLKRNLKKLHEIFINRRGAKPGINSYSEIELWEENYLVRKIQLQYENVPEEIIRNAVKSCYTIYHSPQSGEKLVQCVISKLNAKPLQP